MVSQVDLKWISSGSVRTHSTETNDSSRGPMVLDILYIPIIIHIVLVLLNIYIHTHTHPQSPPPNKPLGTQTAPSIARPFT